MNLTFNNTTTKYVVLTHQPCRDGFMASICARKYYQEKFPGIVPIFHGIEPSKQEADLKSLVIKIKTDDPEHKITDIYIEAFDIAFKSEVILDIIKSNSYNWNIDIYDHHKSSMDAWQVKNLQDIRLISNSNYIIGPAVTVGSRYDVTINGNYTHIYKVSFFNDMNECGASLAWIYYFKHEPIPTFIQYVKDRDNWLFDTPEAKARHSMEVNEYLMATSPKYDDYPAWFEYFNKDQAFFDMAYQGGKMLMDMKNTYVNSIINCGTCRQIDGKNVFVCNSPILVSDVGNAACEKVGTVPGTYLCDYAMIWRYDEKSKSYYVSLRSRKGGMDVQEIAKKYNGGGHICSAGFESNNINFLAL